MIKDNVKVNYELLDNGGREINFSLPLFLKLL